MRECVSRIFVFIRNAIITIEAHISCSLEVEGAYQSLCRDEIKERERTREKERVNEGEMKRSERGCV